jgi:L-threonylcarbamoyladenylate synthase
MNRSFERRAARRAQASPQAIAEAARILRDGGLVAFPTETVYGLGADARNEAAVAALFAAKGRPSFNPLIAHVLDLAAGQRHGRFSSAAVALAQAFWPGPLTLVVPAAPDCEIASLARAGLDTVALRVPAHPVARALLEAADVPIVAPSANLSGRVSPTSAEHALADLQDRVDFVLDGGPAQIGVESTVLACFGAEVRLLRPGGVTRDAIERRIGRRLDESVLENAAPLSPGLLASHYAPRAVLRLNAETTEPGEAALDFGARLLGAAIRLDLSPAGDLVEAAANLFGHLRRLDAAGPETIAAAPIPMYGLGEAINDRLRRAAAPR